MCVPRYTYICDSSYEILQEQIDSMLFGNLSFDTKKEGEDEEEGGT